MTLPRVQVTVTRPADPLTNEPSTVQVPISRVVAELAGPARRMIEGAGRPAFTVLATLLVALSVLALFGVRIGGGGSTPTTRVVVVTAAAPSPSTPAPTPAAPVPVAPVTSAPVPAAAGTVSVPAPVVVTSTLVVTPPPAAPSASYATDGPGPIETDPSPAAPRPAGLLERLWQWLRHLLGLDR